MEDNMYKAIIEMKRHQRVDILVAQCEKGKRLWMERLRTFSIREDGGLLWNNFKVPIMEQLTAVLNPVHVKDDKHTRDVQTLQKQLTDKGFVLPEILWGIERAVKMLVLLRKSCCEKRIEGTLLGKEIFLKVSTRLPAMCLEISKRVSVAKGSKCSPRSKKKYVSEIWAQVSSGKR